MSGYFFTELDARLTGRREWELLSPLGYRSDLLDCTILVPTGFQTDFASVPRIPVIFTLWGDRAHREAVIHDYLYRMDSEPVVSRKEADRVFLEAMKARGKPRYISQAMYRGVRVGGWAAFHKRTVV